MSSCMICSPLAKSNYGAYHNLNENGKIGFLKTIDSQSYTQWVVTWICCCNELFDILHKYINYATDIVSLMEMYTF